MIGLIRQLRVGIDSDDGRVIPFSDLAEINVGEERSREAKLPGIEPFDVVNRDHPANDNGELREASLGKLVRCQWRIGSPKINRSRLDLGDAAARPDGLVVDLDAGRFAVGLRPFREDRINEGRAGARYLLSQGRRRQHAAERRREQLRCETHKTSLRRGSRATRYRRQRSHISRGIENLHREPSMTMPNSPERESFSPVD